LTFATIISLLQFGHDLVISGESYMTIPFRQLLLRYDVTETVINN